MNKVNLPGEVNATWMRGGTSKGLFFLEADLPQDVETRNQFLLRVMGSPDSKQIDGIGGANPLTSKVAIISRSNRVGVDIDYLFLQVFVDKALVSDQQNCGNILAGVGAFAIEQGLVPATNLVTNVTIFMVNSGKIAVATVATPNGKVSYQGNATIDGVPGSAAPVYLEFKDIAGSSCGELLPTGNVIDVIDGIKVTMIDNGMPCLIINAQDVGITGYESKAELDANNQLKQRIEAIRLQAGSLMNLGDVQNQSVPKVTLVAPPLNGGCITTRTFIPHVCHDSIGVFGAVSIATACALTHSVANKLAIFASPNQQLFSIEHPSGATVCAIEKDEQGEIVKSAIVRTTRKLFTGKVFT